MFTEKQFQPQVNLLSTNSGDSHWFSKKVKRLLAPVLITLGSVLIANVAWPILSYQLITSPRINKQELLTPINPNQTVYYSLDTADVTATQVLPTTDNWTPQVLGKDIDYTKASNWFPTHSYEPLGSSKITHYKISIPSVNVEDAVVAIGGEDLSESLIHYPGTANPGQLGAPVIFGHSVLRQFYNPSTENARRYISIFSKIMTLKSGDEIQVSYDGIEYTYLVQEKFEVKPEDVFLLQQRYNDRELKLVTCVPEGTYLRRGVITAQLQDVDQSRVAL